MKPLRTKSDSKAASGGTDLTLRLNPKINILHDSLLLILDLLIMKIIVHEQEQLSSKSGVQRKLSNTFRAGGTGCFLTA